MSLTACILNPATCHNKWNAPNHIPYPFNIALLQKNLLSLPFITIFSRLTELPACKTTRNFITLNFKPINPCT